MFAFSPPKSYGDSHSTPAPKAGDMPGKPAAKPAAPMIPTPVAYTDPQSLGMVQPPKVP